MNIFWYKKIVGLAFLGALLFPLGAFAANLAVVFETNPLFSEADFMPGSAVTKTAMVTNTSGTLQDIISEAVNVIDASHLGEQLMLAIKEGDITLYSNTLSNFLRGGEFALSSLASATSKTYSFTISFKSSAPDTVQKATLGFDLCLGFRGGTQNCGGTVLSSEQDTNNAHPPVVGGGGGGTISGSGSGLGVLTILDITAYATDDVGPGEVRIKWDTNFLSTSQVAYGLAEHGAYTIDLIDPEFGYDFITAKDENKVAHHDVLISGLTPGAVYLYRVISTASPPTVSFERSFTVPSSSLAQNSVAENTLLGVADGTEVGTGISNQVSGESAFQQFVRNGGKSASAQASVGSNIAQDPDVGVTSGQALIPDVVSPHLPDTVAQESAKNSDANRNLASVIFSRLFQGKNWMIFLGLFALLCIIVLSRRRRQKETT